MSAALAAGDLGPPLQGDGGTQASRDHSWHAHGPTSLLSNLLANGITWGKAPGYYCPGLSLAHWQLVD